MTSSLSDRVLGVLASWLGPIAERQERAVRVSRLRRENFVNFGILFLALALLDVLQRVRSWPFYFVAGGLYIFLAYRESTRYAAVYNEAGVTFHRLGWYLNWTTQFISYSSFKKIEWISPTAVGFAITENGSEKRSRLAGHREDIVPLMEMLHRKVSAETWSGAGDFESIRAAAEKNGDAQNSQTMKKAIMIIGVFFICFLAVAALVSKFQP